MSEITIVGMDPSMNNWGLAKVIYNTQTNHFHVTGLGLIRPEYSDSKQVRQNSKDLQRAEWLADKTFEAASDAQVIFAEVPVGTQSANGMKAYGMCVGVLGALRAQGIQFIEVTPNEVKMATVGKKTATKNEIIDRAVARYPEANWPTEKKKGVTRIVTGRAEHMADAIGAIEAGILLPQFKAVLQFLK